MGQIKGLSSESGLYCGWRRKRSKDCSLIEGRRRYIIWCYQCWRVFVRLRAAAAIVYEWFEATSVCMMTGKYEAVIPKPGSSHVLFISSNFLYFME